MKNREKYDNTRWEKEAELQKASQSNSKDYVNCSYTSYAESTRKLSEINIEGEASVSEGGSLRYNKGKPEMSHLDHNFILGIAEVMTASSGKYPKYNWARSQNITTAYDSCMRHIFSFMNGEDYDPVEEGGTGKHHLLHAAANLMIMWYSQQHCPEADDRKFKKPIAN